MKNNVYEKFIIDTTENLCKLIAKTERSNVGARMFKGWTKYGQYPEGCPILVGIGGFDSNI